MKTTIGTHTPDTTDVAWRDWLAGQVDDATEPGVVARAVRDDQLDVRFAETRDALRRVRAEFEAGQAAMPKR